MIPSRKIGNFEIRYRRVPFALVYSTSAGMHGDGKMYELLENGNLWMTNDMYEYNIMKFALDRCAGRVLVGGLGIGMVTELLAKKDSVREIVVVERAQEVIDLVWDHIDTRGKGTIVKDDFFHYLETTEEEFDYVYSDIHPLSDVAAYEKFIAPVRKLAERKFPSERILIAEEDHIKKLYAESGGVV